MSLAVLELILACKSEFNGSNCSSPRLFRGAIQSLTNLDAEN